MAGHLARAGHAVTVYNRTPAKAQAWVGEHGHAAAATPAAAAAEADIVFACVGNDDGLRGVVFGDRGAFGGMKPGAIFVDHTTASAEVARELSAAALPLGLQFIDAPVSGGNLGAINGALTVMCGGDAVAFGSIHPVAMACSKAVTLLGASGAGQLEKMVNQIAIAGLVQGLAEAIAFGDKAGLDMMAVLGVIGKTGRRAGSWTTAARRWSRTGSTSVSPSTGCERTWAWYSTKRGATVRACPSRRWSISSMPTSRRRAGTGSTPPA